MAQLIKQAKTDKFRLGTELQYFENADIMSELPLKNGKILYTLTEKEKKKVEEFYGLELDNPAHLGDWLERVMINTKPTIDIIDPNNPEDILKKGVLIANNTYAPNLEAADDVMAGYKFVLYDQEQEEEAKATLYEVQDQAIVELAKLRKKKVKLIAVAKYVLPATTGIQNSEVKAYTLLREYVDGKFEGTSKRKAIDEFLDAVHMDELKLFVTVDFKEAYIRNIIRTDGEMYFHNPSSGTRYGKTRDESIKFLMNPKNQEELGLNNKDDKPYSIRYQLKKN